MPDTWTRSRLLGLEAIQDALEGIDTASDAVRLSSRLLETIADIVGAASGILSLVSAPSPQIGILNSVAGRLQSLINGFLNTGAYTIVHHNLAQVLDAVGVVNVVPEEVRRLIEPVATPIEGSAGYVPSINIDLEHQGLGALFDDLEGGTINDIRGFEDWLGDIIEAFDDPSDRRRPRLSSNGAIGGYIFLAGAKNLPDLLPLITGLAAITEISEFERLAEGIAQAFDQDFLDWSRLSEFFAFRNVNEIYGRSGVAPDFLSIILADFIPGLGRIFVGIQEFAEFLTKFDAIGSSISEFTRAIESRIRRLSQLFDTVAQLVDYVGLLIGLPEFSVLRLDVEVGGVAGMKDRIAAALDRPSLGPGTLIVGGGIFVTAGEAMVLLDSIIEDVGDFLDRELAPTDNFVGVYRNSESPEGQVLELSRIASNILNKVGYGDAAPRGGARNTGGGVGGETNRSTAGSGGSRIGLYRTGPDGTLAEDSALGARLAGVELRHASWGVYDRELLRLGLLRGTQNRSYLTETGSGILIASHVSFHRPRIEAVPFNDEDKLLTSLLIEGPSVNEYLDSDRFRVSTPAPSVTSTILDAGSPTTDLLYFRDEAGPVTRFAPTAFPAVVAEGLQASIFESGAALYHVLGYTVQGSDVGRTLVGYQRIRVLGADYDNFFVTTILNVDVLQNGWIIDDSVFTEPVAVASFIENMVLLDGPLDTHVDQVVSRGDPRNWFSVFGRSVEKIPLKRGFAARYGHDTHGPSYGNQLDLELPLKRVVLPPLTITDRLVSLTNPGGTNIEEGDVGEIWIVGETQSVPIIVDEVDNGATLGFKIHPLIGQEIGWDDLDIEAIYIFEAEGTYLGFRRMDFPVPTRHLGHTSPIPLFMGVPGGQLTLAHSSIDFDSLRAWVVVDLSTKIEIFEDPLLAGYSWRREAGTGPGNRDVIELSTDLINPVGLYYGKLVEVEYDLPYTTGTLEIYPNWMTKESGPWTPPDVGSGVDVWRAQWEPGNLSSPIPTSQASSRERAGDIGEMADAGMSIPREEVKYEFVIFPKLHSGALLEPATLLDAEPTVLIQLEPDDDDMGRVVLTVLGTSFYSDPVGWSGTARLDIRVEFTFDADAEIGVSVDLGPVQITPFVGVPPVVDTGVTPAAKMYLGSRGGQSEFLNGRIAVTIKGSRT